MVITLVQIPDAGHCVYDEQAEQFNAAVLRAVKQWRYEPATKNGKPVRIRIRIPFAFPAHRDR